MIDSTIHSAVSVCSTLLALAQSVNPRISFKMQTHQGALKRFLRNAHKFTAESCLNQEVLAHEWLSAAEAKLYCSVYHQSVENNVKYVISHIENVLAIVLSQEFADDYLQRMTVGQLQQVQIKINQLRLARQLLATAITSNTPLVAYRQL